MHLASAEHHYWGGHAIVGGHLPLATGVGPGDPLQGEARGRAVRPGRRHHQHRLFPRVDQPGRRLEAAGRLPGREQPVRHGHRGRARVGRVQHLREGLRLRHRSNRQSTARTCWRSTRPWRRRWTTRARKARVLLEALTYRYVGPLDGRPGALPHQGRDRGVARARSDLPARASKLTAEGRRRQRSSEFTQVQSGRRELAEIVQLRRGKPRAGRRRAVRARLRQPASRDRSI